MYDKTDNKSALWLVTGSDLGNSKRVDNVGRLAKNCDLLSLVKLLLVPNWSPFWFSNERLLTLIAFVVSPISFSVSEVKIWKRIFCYVCIVRRNSDENLFDSEDEIRSVIFKVI